MGIYIDYVLRAECAEVELYSRLEKVRQRCLDLPLRSVGKVQRIAPVYSSVVMMLLQSEGHTLPDAIAERLRQVHETVCRVLDIVQEEGLLLEGSDNCGYYATRSWKDASQRVNEELQFAQIMGGLMGVTVGNLREEGVPVQVLADNASKAKPVDFSAALAREQEAESEE